MTTMTKSLIGASPDLFSTWDDLPWSAIEKQVRRQQMRIAKAIRSGRVGKAKALQRLLTSSFYGKCLAVKRVVFNKGAKTPGVDTVLWRTSHQRMKGVMALRRRGYHALPLKRIYIPKKGGKLRPLSIPTMKDRAMQSLWKLALDPICEEKADPNSYGFRPKRSAADAIEQCHIVLSRGNSAQWILEGDIKSCFDKISHDWLLENIPMDKTILKKFLKAGFMLDGKYAPTGEGTPQGGILSPTLTVMTLTGLEAEIKSCFKRGTKANVICYADDFIITAASREILETKVLPQVVAFLKQRGLSLSDEKTRICHIDEGFDFLGFNIRKYKGKLLTKPSKASVKGFLKGIRETIRSFATARSAILIHHLNPKIRGWCQYYRHSCASKAFSYIGHQIYVSLAQWVHRRHARMSQAKALKKYFKSFGLRNWVFAATMTVGGQKKTLQLYNAAGTGIKRHIKIRGLAHPFDPRFKEYFEMRKKRTTRT